MTEHARGRLAALALLALGTSGCILDRSGHGPVDADDAATSVDAGSFDAGPTPPDAAREDAGPVLEPPGAPGTPTFSDTTETSTRVAWAAPTSGGPVDYYQLERAPDSAGAPGPFTTVVPDVGVTSFVDAGLEARTSYWYRVRAHNLAGAGPYSEPAALRTLAPLAVTRVQDAYAEGVDPTASFAAPPTPGNLLVAVAFHRLDEVEARIDGWDTRLSTHFQMTINDRRGLSVLSRVVAAGDGTDVELSWSTPTESQLLVQEFVAFGVTWSFETAASDDTGTAVARELTVSTSPLPMGDFLLVGAFGSRDDSGDVVFEGLTNALQRSGARTSATAFALRAGASDAQTTTATWSTGRRATAGLVVFRLAR